jgi:hypothetical protein
MPGKVKRTISRILFVSFITSLLFSMQVFALSSGIAPGGFGWSINPDWDSVTVTKIASNTSGYERTITIPGTLNGLRVTEVALSGMYSKGDQFDSLYYANVVIPNGVTSINDYGFYNYHNLQSVTIPNTVTYIGESAFRNCGLKSDLIIPGSVKSIGKLAFSSSGIRSVTIKDGVKSIGASAFSGCRDLAVVTLPKSVTEIGIGAFDNTRWLNSYEGDFAIVNNILIKYKGKDADVTIPNGVVSFAEGAFGDNKSIKSVTIPNSVKSISNYAFSGCSNLSAINIPNSVTSIGNNAFAGCVSLSAIDIPDSVTSIGDNAFASCSSLRAIDIPYSVTSIGYNAFASCNSLSAVNIANSTVNIGNGAFLGTRFVIDNKDEFVIVNNILLAYKGKSANVTIPGGVKNIGGTAFLNYANTSSPIESVTIPDGVTRIGDGAFYNCNNLKSVTIPSSVTSIGDEAFYRCALTSITIPNSVTSIGKSAFKGCALTSVTIPGSVKTIGDGAFSNCWNLTNVIISNGVTGIGNSAFSDCSGLKSITIPGSVRSIGDEAFYRCSLTGITIPDGVISIGNNAFNGANRFESVIIPNSVKEIGFSAFKISKSVTVPSSVTRIGHSAFGDNYVPYYYKAANPIIIYGEANSTIEKYAKHRELNFVVVKSSPKPAAPAAVKAVPTTSAVLVNGKATTFESYNINGSNYFKLRDLAKAVDGTPNNFEVSWDAEKKTINLLSNTRYTPVGGELTKGDGKTKSAVVSTATILKDGVELPLSAYTINGSNYFKLRDVADAFGIGVTWDSKTNTISITTAADPSSAPNSQTQEQAMAKYIVKKASISYKGENYNVYLLNNDYNVKATRDKDFNLVIYKPEGELNLFNEVYFDSKGNFVTDKKTYTDLRKLYLMGLCKDGLLVDKKYNGTIIPSMIFGKTLTEIGGRAGFTAILTKDPASIGRALTDELKSGFVNQTFASIIWASYEWYGNPSYEGIKKSLDSLYDTKTGIAVTVNNSGIYTISDNYSYHKSLSVDAMFRNWMTAYNRYSVFLKALDDLELTVQGGDNDFETAKEIIKDVGDIFLSAISDDTAEVILNNGTVSDKKLKELIKKYVDLEKVDISFSLNEGLKFSNTKTEFLEGTLSLMDSTLSFKTKYQNMTKNRLSKFEDAADITIGRQDASSVEAHIKNVVGDKDFKMPMKK